MCTILNNQPFSPKLYRSISGTSSVGFNAVSIPGMAVVVIPGWSPSVEIIS